MDDTPLVLTPPEHQTPMQTQGVVACCIGGVILALCISTTALRFYLRHMKKTSWGVDDTCIIISLLLEIGYVTVLLWGIKNGGGGAFDVYLLPLYEQSIFLKALWISKFFIDTVYTTVKVSVIFFYRRIFFVDKEFRRASNIILVFAILWWMVSMVVAIVACLPIDYAWIVTSEGIYLPNHCINHAVYIACMESLNLVLDLAVLGLPILELRKLHIKTSQKYGLAGIFALGGLVIVAGVIRIAVDYAPTRSMPFMYLIHFSIIETGVAIVCANLPCFGVLIVDIRQLAPKFRHWRDSIERAWSVRWSHGHRLSGSTSFDDMNLAKSSLDLTGQIHNPQPLPSENDDKRAHLDPRMKLEGHPEV